VPRVAELLRAQGREHLDREGLALPVAAAVGVDDEPPCPACGTAAPLVEGACADCGLQLA
jgi:hypothetical protein